MAGHNRTKRRILHTSDLHLELLNDRACESLAALVDRAGETKVDLVVIVGDLFDNNRVTDHLVTFVAEQLRTLAVPTIILPGNHDCLVPDSVYHRVGPWQSLDNVRILRAPQGETLVLSELGVSIWGRPIVSHSDCRPLEGVPQPQRNGQWHIALAHGYYVDRIPPAFPSFHISHKEISTSGQDYIALGHLPTFSCVCNEPVKAYYCGSPSWTFPQSTVNIVDLTEEVGVQVTRYPLS